MIDQTIESPLEGAALERWQVKSKRPAPQRLKWVHVIGNGPDEQDEKEGFMVEPPGNRAASELRIF